jgi:hypothetical protein
LVLLEGRRARRLVRAGVVLPDVPQAERLQPDAGAQRAAHAEHAPPGSRTRRRHAPTSRRTAVPRAARRVADAAEHRARAGPLICRATCKGRGVRRGLAGLAQRDVGCASRRGAGRPMRRCHCGTRASARARGSRALGQPGWARGAVRDGRVPRLGLPRRAVDRRPLRPADQVGQPRGDGRRVARPRETWTPPPGGRPSAMRRMR